MNVGPEGGGVYRKVAPALADGGNSRGTCTHGESLKSCDAGINVVCRDAAGVEYFEKDFWWEDCDGALLPSKRH